MKNWIREHKDATKVIVRSAFWVLLFAVTMSVTELVAGGTSWLALWTFLGVVVGFPVLVGIAYVVALGVGYAIGHLSDRIDDL